LDGPEKLLFDRISVFAGAFDLAAAESVCSNDDLNEYDVPDLLASLVEKSMVLAERHDDTTRFRLLETLREYGALRLKDRGEEHLLRAQHQAHFLRVARSAHLLYRGRTESRGVSVYSAEWDNLRAALQWAIAADDGDDAVALVELTFWFAMCWFRFEHADWVDTALRVTDTSGAQRARLFGFAAGWRIHHGDPAGALQLAEKGLEVAGTDERGNSWCWQAAALGHLFLGHGPQALAASHEACTFAARSGDADIECVALRTLVLSSGGADSDRVVEHAARHRRLAESLGAPFELAHTAYFAGFAQLAIGQSESAIGWLERCFRLAAGTGPFMEAVALFALAEARLLRHDPDAPETLRHAVLSMYKTRNWHILWVLIELLANHWVSTGRREPGAVLLGHLESCGQSNAAVAHQRAEALRALGETEEARQWLDAGALMDRDGLVAYALGQLEQ
jgi:tetratricopeptide (TPR) repeat protein